MSTARLVTNVRVRIQHHVHTLTLDDARELARQLAHLTTATAAHEGHVRAAVAVEFGVTETAITSRRRFAPIVTARHVAAWLLHELTDSNQSEIGRILCYSDGTPRDPGTISHAIKNVMARMSVDKPFAARVHTLRANLEKRLQ